MTVPSLQELCGIKLVVAFSTRSDSKEKIFDLQNGVFGCYVSYLRWKSSLESYVDNEMKSKKYPFRLKKIIPMYLFQLIGLHMIKWVEFLQSYFRLSLKFGCGFLRCSFFTSRGRIDEEKAARELIKDPSLKPFIQYKIACYYFLSDMIPSLWQMMCDREPNFKHFLKGQNPEEPFILWSDYYEKETSTSASEVSYEMDDFIERAFPLGSAAGNVAAVKFCWKTRNAPIKYKNVVEVDTEKGIIFHCIRWPSLFMVIKKLDTLHLKWSNKLVRYANVLEFLFIQMNKKEIKKFLTFFEIPCNILRCLLFWPYQHLFQKAIEKVYDFIDKKQFYDLMQNIVDMIEDPDFGQSYNYRLLLREFWINSPSHLRDYVLAVEGLRREGSSNAISKELLFKLFNLQKFTDDDESNILLILEPVSPREIGNNSMGFKGSQICRNLISNGNFRLADAFLRSLSLSEEKHRKFKIDLAIGMYKKVIENESLDKGDQLIKWAVDSDEVKDDLKQRILCVMTQREKIFTIFKLFKKSFINKLLLNLLNTEDKIEEWKRSVVLDLDIGNEFILNDYEPKSLDELFEWLGYTEDKILKHKERFLNCALPHIILKLHKAYCNSIIDEDCISKIMRLCSNKEEIINGFISQFRDLCDNHIEHILCEFCSPGSFFVDYPVNPENLCCRHNDGVLSFEEVDYICILLEAISKIYIC